MQKFKSLILPFSLLTITIALMLSCSAQRKTGYEMMREVRDLDLAAQEDTNKKIYLTGTIPIDSAEIDKLIYEIDRIEIDEYPDNLKVYARVYDSLGRFVTNMADPYKKEGDTNIYFTSVGETLGEFVNVRKVPIENFNVREYGAGDSIPYNIVLSVDYSGSIKPMIGAIFEGTELFVSLKFDYDKIALTSFSRKMDVKVPLIQDSSKILHLYRTNRRRGLGLFSGVYDGLLNCVELFRGTSKEVPRVLVVFSDGDDNYSKKNIGELIDSAKANKIHIFAVAFGYSKDENLRYMAQYTGGKFYKAYTKEELIAIFRDIYMSLRYYYYITYDPPKYWGKHFVKAALNHPDREDTLFAHGMYDTKDLFPWDSINKVFERNILFEFDSAVVRPESYPILDEIAEAMLSYPKLQIQIEGHTDNIGPEGNKIEYNQELSERRAAAVRRQLIERGVEPRRLRSRGFGMSQPVASNETEEGRALNRRTEFRVIAK